MTCDTVQKKRGGWGGSAKVFSYAELPPNQFQRGMQAHTHTAPGESDDILCVSVFFEFLAGVHRGGLVCGSVKLCSSIVVLDRKNYAGLF